MSNRTERKINGGFAIYYGMGAAMGAVASFIALIVWIVKVAMGKTGFDWGVPVAMLLFTLVSGFVAYLLLKTGYEEIED
ncbi:MAG: hypothetical protein KIT62_01375 [Cyclobacteriaceae bacterium]|nr:hypothetical protein [Cyclobacteriaceae bacterium]